YSLALVKCLRRGEIIIERVGPHAAVRIEREGAVGAVERAGQRRLELVLPEVEVVRHERPACVRITRKGVGDTAGFDHVGVRGNYGDRGDILLACDVDRDDSFAKRAVAEPD